MSSRSLSQPTRSPLSWAGSPALVALAATVALGSSCAAVAAAGVGYVVSQQVLPNDVHITQVADDVDRVWATTKEAFYILVDPATETEEQEFPRVLRGKIDGAKVEITVEAYDIDRTVIRVQAEKYLSADNATSSEVMETILDRLAR